MRTMSKRILSVLLCAGLMLALALTCFAEETEETEDTGKVLYISTEDQLLSFAEDCRLDSYSRNLTVVLKADLDMTGLDFSGIPSFSGTFDGGGHRIAGLDLSQDGSFQGLFRYLTETALVRDLTVLGSLEPGGSRSRIGGIAGSNAGRIENCAFEGRITAADGAGGIAGVNTVTGVIEDCDVSGSISGNHFVGGMAGENRGVIRGCINQAQINVTSQENEVALEDVTMDTILSSEAAGTVTDVGGIAGNSTGVIRDCENYGDVGYRLMGYNIGGIAGTQSGYITGCRNQGAIQGRKEVGGIVGQMEPAALVTYDEDALQILQRQLKAMSGTISKTTSNLQGAAQDTYGQAQTMMEYVQEAYDAVDMLIPDDGGIQLPDEDSILAAQNAIAGSLAGMQHTLEGMTASTQTALGTLTNNLSTLQSQINAMSETLNNVSQTMGGSIADVSDSDTPADLTGKVSDCRNLGPVLADLNAGGIAGAMALENDLDAREDLQIQGESSLNFESQLRAVTLNCENRGVVTVGKQCAGGIVGWQPFGLVKECRNTGDVEAQDAEYVGGIAGQSQGFIRASSAKCQISGRRWEGGIAGSAAVVTDCRSMVQLLTATERRGAVLGDREEDTHQQETPIAGNYYFPVSGDPGGIDGISYDGLAQPLTQEAFFALEGLAELFRQVSVTFQYDDGTESTLTVAFGSALEEDWIPEVPVRDGAVGHWEGLEEADLSQVVFDMTFRASYTDHLTVIQSTPEEGQLLPLLLTEGEFTPGAVLTVETLEGDDPALDEDQTMEGVWRFETTNVLNLTRGRLRLPEGLTEETLSVRIRGWDGVWREESCVLDGSYLTFPLEMGDGAVALIREDAPLWPAVLAGSAGAVLLLGILAAALIRRRGNGKPQAQEPAEKQDP